MDSEKFEREILKLAFETDIRITVATVAYYFGIPSRDARTKLDELIDAGLLELDSDREGNLFYKLHQEAGSAAADRIEELIAPTQGNEGGNASPKHSDGTREGGRPSLNQTASPVSSKRPHSEASSEGASPVSRNHYVEHNVGATDTPENFSYPGHSQRNAQTVEAIFSPTQSSFPRSTDATKDLGPQGGHARVGAEQNQSYWHAPQYERHSTQVRGYRPDAAANSCGSSAFVVAEGVTCDGKHTLTTPPNTSTCDESVPNYPPHYTLYPNSAPLSYTEQYYREQQFEAMTPAVYEPSQQELIEQDRVHHPAIAVILSLCLPGAGQFYNGQIEKGVFMMLMTFLSWMAFFGWAFQLWSIFDALIVASRIRSAQEAEKQRLELTADSSRRMISSNRY